MKIQGIYEILNTANGKKYVGQAGDIEQRFRQHRNFLRQGKHCNYHLQSAWTKYGENEFLFRIIEVCAEDQLSIREQFWFDTAKPEYNLVKIAGSMRGYKHSPESIEKNRMAQLGTKHGPVSPEKSAKLSAALMGNTRGRARRGMKQSEAAKLLISLAHKGKPLTQAHKDAIGRGVRGLIKSPEARAKIGESKVGRHLVIGPHGERRFLYPKVANGILSN